MYIGRQSRLFKEYMEIGAHTYGAPINLKRGNAKLIIGKYCSIADNVTVFLGYNHDTSLFTVYPIKQLLLRIGNKGDKLYSKGNINVGNDVWIGSHAVLMSGITIGDGAVIGAYSVVTKDVPAYTIFAGNPGKIMRHRFDLDVTFILEKLKWWDWSDEKVKENADILQSSDKERLKELYEMETHRHN